jgi:hypothetical protein
VIVDDVTVVEALRPGAPGHDEAVRELHALLLRAARFAAARRALARAR